MHRIYQRTVSVLLISVMILLIFNNSVYTHVHVLPDGSMVTHAHPFQKRTDSGQGTGHSHSSTVCFLLSHLEILFLLVAASLILLHSAGIRRLTPEPAATVYPSHIHLTPGRAPPHCM